MQTRVIEYHHNDTLLEAYLAHDETKGKPKPAVMVVHDWSGRNEFACKKAEKLAELGYIGFAIDMFGKGVLGRTKDEKSNLIQPLIQNRAELQQRLQIALEILQTQPEVDKNKIAIIGFCFGGLCALDLARTGADIRGAISFHGLFGAPENIPHPKIKAKILALHGHDDPMVPPDQVLAFETEMTKAKADWQLHVYGNTKHAFTNPEANDPEFGTVFDSCANDRSWLAMQNFLNEIFV